MLGLWDGRRTISEPGLGKILSDINKKIHISFLCYFSSASKNVLEHYSTAPQTIKPRHKLSLFDPPGTRKTVFSDRRIANAFGTSEMLFSILKGISSESSG